MADRKGLNSSDKEGKLYMIEYFFSWVLDIFIVSLPIMWAWVLYHKIKCRKIDSCTNRKCKYWSLCTHNREERKKDDLEFRKQNLMRQRGLSEDERKS